MKNNDAKNQIEKAKINLYNTSEFVLADIF